jgi:thiamine-monophosphate kinase
VPLPEKQIIAGIRRRAKTSRSILTGIGDDSAVLRPPRGREILVTTDLSLEGTHFRREWHPADSVGHRCLARGLSDIAAMGGDPLAAFLSFAVPADLPQKWVEGFLRGFLALADRFQCPLAGGDIAESLHGVIADVMVVSSVPRKRAILRSGARAGDNIYVTEFLGSSTATLQRLYRGEKLRASKSDRHFYPEPRIAVGRWLRERKLATSMIDLSDGLSIDLAHICDESGVRAVLNEPLIPIAPGATLEQSLHGGEDYELLFTARAGAKIPPVIAGVPMTEIGWIEAGRGVLITDLKSKPRRLESKGWEHFSLRASAPLR